MPTKGSLPEREARPRPRRETVVLVVPGRLQRADLPPLIEHVRLLLERTATEVLVCDVAAAREPDVVYVEALARVQLVACRLGCRVRLRNAGDRLRDILNVTGLADVIGEPDPRRTAAGATSRVEEAGRRAGTTERYRGRR